MSCFQMDVSCIPDLSDLEWLLLDYLNLIPTLMCIDRAVAACTHTLPAGGFLDKDTAKALLLLFVQLLKP